MSSVPAIKLLLLEVENEVLLLARDISVGVLVIPGISRRFPFSSGIGVSEMFSLSFPSSSFGEYVLSYNESSQSSEEDVLLDVEQEDEDLEDEDLEEVLEDEDVADMTHEVLEFTDLVFALVTVVGQLKFPASKRRKE